MNFRAKVFFAALTMILGGTSIYAAARVDPKKAHCECYCAGVGVSGNCFGVKVNLPDRDLCSSYNGDECALGGRLTSCTGVGSEGQAILLEKDVDESLFLVK